MSKLTCSVEGCGGAHKSLGLCSRHYARKRKGKPLIRPCKSCGLGDVDTLHGYHPGCQPRICVMCDSAPVSKPHSDVCSFRCRALLRREAKKLVTCKRCGEPVDLWAEGKDERRKRSDTNMCTRCRLARYTRHKVSTSVLANTWGTDCNVCGEPVDLTLKSPDPFRASVDHEIPFSRGGSHDIENLRLAHLWCNQVKHDRQGFRI